MKKFLKIAGVLAMLLVVYAALQGLFTGVVMVVFLVSAVIRGEVSIEQLHDITAINRITDVPGLGDNAISVMAIGLFLAAASMLMFIHLTKLFRLR